MITLTTVLEGLTTQLSNDVLESSSRPHFELLDVILGCWPTDGPWWRSGSVVVTGSGTDVFPLRVIANKAVVSGHLCCCG
ncbi:hypothetical protein [Micromonospora sp. NPDC005203]|uniref:hypothetical protein n=1 Tax=Micromonospora sp. NPDC005203 TaxID=3364226 RepID=UPI00368D5339